MRFDGILWHFVEFGLTKIFTKAFRNDEGIHGIYFASIS